MTDLHQVIVDDVGQVIGRVAVRLEQDEILEVGILKDDLAAQQIEDRRLATERHAETNRGRHPGREIQLHLPRGEIAAEAVEAGRFLTCGLLLAYSLQAFRGAETAVGVPALQESRGVLLIEVGPLACR